MRSASPMRLARHERAHAVDVTADDVATHPRGELQRALEVQRDAERERAERGLRRGFRRRRRLRSRLHEGVDREAHAVNANRLAER